MVMTYNSLVAQIQSYLNRNDADTIAQIPNFISQAEQKICRESKNIGLEKYVVSNFITGVSVYQKPGRWRRNITFNFGNGGGANNTRNQIYLRAYEYLRIFWPDSTQTGTPLYYSDYGYNNFLVAPTPDQDYPFELAYLELPIPLSPSQQTNWLTTYAPDLILYASLLEAMPFLKDDERVPIWKSYYDEALSSVNNQDNQRVVDRASNRSSD